jgi:hypothetical protein
VGAIVRVVTVLLLTRCASVVVEIEREMAGDGEQTAESAEKFRGERGSNVIDKKK